jgi:modulator of FtsH protease
MSNFPAEQRQRPRFGTLSGELATGLQAKVFGLLAFCFAFAGAGGAVGYRYVEGGAFLPLFIVYIGLVFGVQAARNKEGLNIALLYAATFTTGLIVGPIVESYVGSGAGNVVFQAAAIAGGMTVGLSAYALTTKRNLTGLQPILFVAVLGLIIASVANIWVGGSMMYGIISWAGAVLFSVLLVFDVNRTRHTADTMGNAVVITLSVFLDIVNLFLFMTRILNGGRR